MTRDDLLAYSIVAGILLVVVFFLFKEFKLLSFNAEFAQISGLPVRSLQFVLSSITVLAIATGIQAVGVVLMAALIITPAAAARSWTENLVKLLFIAGFAGMLSGFVGSYISFTAPNMPTGPWIVMTLSAIAVISLVFAPGRGLWSKMRRQRQNREKILTENILKAIYHLSERRDETFPVIDEEALQQIRQFNNDELTRGLRMLKKRYLLLRQSTGFRLSEEGLKEAARVVRLHRLWEMYLTQRMRLKADHIHPNAETIEHIISPEIEEELLRDLGYPDKDPHESPIPYR